jgi:hypothetical protein
VIVAAAGLALALSAWHWPRGAPAEAAIHRDVLPPGPDVEALLRRTRARELVVDRLLAGELTLAQAAARFGYLNEHPARFRVPIHNWPGRCDSERLCRQVIGWLESYYQDKGFTYAQVEAALEPYEAELSRLLAENEEFDLPPID